mgnify:CR=1 FL=1
MVCRCGFIGVERDFYSANTCKKCKQLKTKEWQLSNPEKAYEINKRKNVKSKYGLTLEEYDACMSSSEGCEICGSTSNLIYDHDHTMPKDITAFRGVLCQKCNTGVGKLGDDIEGLLKAVEYLIIFEENKENNK